MTTGQDDNLAAPPTTAENGNGNGAVTRAAPLPPSRADVAAPPPGGGVAAWARRHTRSVIFLLLVLVGAGAVSALHLPVALFPQVDFPRVKVTIDAGDRPAERMAVEVTYPVEESLRAIPGVRSVRSTTSRGSAEISVNFDWGADMVAAMLQVESQINKTLPSLPQGTSFDVIRMDPTVFPVIAYSLTSDSRSLTELRDLAQYRLRPTLTTVTGVAKVDVQGGAVEELRVVVDQGKLRSFGLGLTDVAAALSASNVLTAVGHLEDHDKLYLIVSDTRFKDPREVDDTVIRAGPNGVVHLGDVASVRRDVAPSYTRVTADGHDAVLMQVYQQPGGNTVQIARQIRATLGELRNSEPMLKDDSVKVANWYDQSELITSSAATVRDAVLIGVALAAVVLLVFLRNWKITLIAMIAVPSVLAVTVLLLYVLHMSFNIMTLGGMAAAVGLIIDDAIVMVEHIVRRLRGGIDGRRAGVIEAAREFTVPLVGSSLATIIIHIPPAFMTGVGGEFFKALSLTMAVSLVVSFLVAWLAIPVLASKWLTARDGEHEEHGPVSRGVNGAYAGMMRGLLHAPWLVLLIILPLGALGYYAYSHVGSGFMPTMDEGGFTLDYIAPPGTSLTETDRLLRRLEAILRSTPEVDTYSRRTGLQLGGGLTEANTGDIFVRLKPFPRRPIEEVMDEVRKRAQKGIPGLDIDTSQLMEDEIGDLTSVPQPIEIKIFSDDQQVLGEVAPKVAGAIGKVAGVQEVKSGIIFAGDALDVQVDRVKASLEGVDPDAVTKILNDSLTGNVTTQIQQGPKLVGVRVWTPRDIRATQRDLADLPILAANGHAFPLSRVATISIVAAQPEINRDDLRRMAAVTARIDEKHDLGSTVAAVKKVLDAPGLLPPGMRYELGGLYQQQQIAFRDLSVVIVAAAVLVFALLLYLYESFRVAVSVLLTTLLAAMAVFVGLWVTATELNITALMGMVMIVGNVTEVAIFYYSEYAALAEHAQPQHLLVAAGTNRMRAITMTTIAAILALLPLALGIGQGSAMQQPLAIAIISGLIAQLPLVLIVLPLLLKMLGAAKDARPAIPVRQPL